MYIQETRTPADADRVGLLEAAEGVQGDDGISEVGEGEEGHNSGVVRTKIAQQGQRHGVLRKCRGRQRRAQRGQAQQVNTPQRSSNGTREPFVRSIAQTLMLMISATENHRLHELFRDVDADASGPRWVGPRVDTR